ncbi:MAG: phosphohistidine phosphatase [Arenicella sp.]|jgi:phosphohistidine phosphatase
MLKLFLLRHGKACAPKVDQKDYDRPLNKKGLAQINQIGFQLKNNDTKGFELIFSSAKRTSETAVILNHHLHFSSISDDESLYLASEELILKHLMFNAKEASVVFVGHNFGISNLASQLSGKSISMSTGMLIEFEFDIDDWKTLKNAKGRIVHSITPNVFIP